MTLETLLVLASLTAFAALSLGLLISADRQRRQHRRRLSRARADRVIAVLPTPQAKRTKPSGQGSLVVQLERQLAQTSLRVSVVELFVQLSIAVLTCYALGVLVLGLHPLIAVPIAVPLPLLVALCVLNVAKGKYRTDFTADLPEALDVFARGLRAGRPVADSLSIVVDNSKGVINREFSRCRDEISMGKSLPDSLGRLKTRVPTADVSFFAVATALQAETGGNLIETMEGLAAQLRERRKLRKKARALSSEAKASAVILAALPFVVTLAIALLNASYIEPLFTDPRGRVMAAAGFASVCLGVAMMIKMGKLDV